MSSAGNAALGTVGVLAAPFTGGASLGLTAYAASSYEANKAKQGARELDVSAASPPPPPPAATPATLAQASAATNAKAAGGAPSRARAAGTIGDQGPQGLQAPPQTANLTLLGGTK